MARFAAIQGFKALVHSNLRGQSGCLVKTYLEKKNGMPQSTGGVRPAPQFRYGEWFAQNNRNLTHPFFPAHPDAAEYPLRFSPHSTIFRVKFDRGHNSPPAITCRLGLSLVVKPHTQPTYLRAEFPPKATAPKFAAWSDCSGAGKWANSSGFVSRNPVIDGEI